MAAAAEDVRFVRSAHRKPRFCSRQWEVITMRISSVSNCLLLLMLLVLTFGLGGCNTVAGVGEDLEAAGSGLEESAERRQSY